MKITQAIQKVFNPKQYGDICRFGVNINHKEKDGTYSEGMFIDAVYFNGVLDKGALYKMDGYLEDTEYNGVKKLQFKVTNAEPYSRNSQGYSQQKPQPKPMPKQELPQIDLDEEIPF